VHYWLVSSLDYYLLGMYYLLLKNKEYSKARDISSEMKSIKPQKLKFTGKIEEVRKLKMLVHSRWRI
jgi:hypothetical protein